MSETDHPGVERWSPAQAWVYAAVARNPRSNRLIVEHLDPGPGDVVLDVGCGAGAAVRAAARTGAEAIGIDPSDAMVRNAERRSSGVANARFKVGHAAQLPLDDDSVTGATAISTYHHWPDGEAGLREVRRVLQPGGRFVIAERRLKRGPGHGLSPLEAAEVTTLMRDVGFETAEVSERKLRIFTLLLVSGVA